MIDMGGGFPATYVDPTNELSVYASEITRFLTEDFGDDLPEIILEPGRSLVGDSGILTDAGKFNGLIETIDECIKYPVITTKDGDKEGEVIIAGPTCDSMDVMYETTKYKLPVTLKQGDRMYWLSTGAYTTTYASVAFNGFPPIQTYYI